MSAFFAWNEQYSVGVKAFDDHHKQLIALINQLYDAMKAGKGAQEVRPVLTQLMAYTQFHFNSEEQLLARYAYPDFPHHKKEHESLKARVAEFQGMVDRGTVGTAVQVGNFLKDWLTNHIVSEDKKYGAFLSGKVS